MAADVWNGLNGNGFCRVGKILHCEGKGVRMIEEKFAAWKADGTRVNSKCWALLLREDENNTSSFFWRIYVM